MLPTGSPLARLLDAPMRPGSVTWIGLRPGRQAAMLAVPSAALDPAHGVQGDRYGTPGGRRQVTVLDEVALAAIALCLGMDAVAPATLRRNIVVRGLNLHALRGRRFQLGSAVLEATGDCHPCSRMEAALGPGGYNAVRGRGGITARVLVAGVVALGDAISRLDLATAAPDAPDASAGW